MQRKEILRVVGSGRGGTSSIGIRNGKLVDGFLSSWGNEIGILVSF